MNSDIVVDIEEHKRQVADDVLELANNALCEAHKLVRTNIEKLEDREVSVSEMKAGILIMRGKDDDSRTWHWKGKKIVRLTGIRVVEDKLTLDVIDLLDGSEGT